MTTKKTGFDFSALDTVKKSTEGVLFLFVNMQGDELDAGAVMYGPDSPAFKRAHNQARARVMKASAKKGKDENILDDLEEEEKLEKVVACCVTLEGCFIGDKQYKDSPEDIREFFTKLPFMRDQMYSKLVSRSNFLPSAATAG